MSNTTSTDMAFKVQDYGQDTHVLPQYGMRYPNGDIIWVQARTHHGHTVRFAGLAEDNPNSMATWDEGLMRAAEAAKIDATEYSEGHQLVKRTVIVAVTEAEDVK